MGDYRKLVVWQRARLLTVRVYQITQPFPPTERYGLTSQIRGASVSILANLAEGCGRNRVGELKHFLSIALGSAAELECHVILARDLGYLSGDQAGEVLSELEEIRRMLAGTARRLARTTAKRPTN
jgi:four helix bundle protein